MKKFSLLNPRSDLVFKLLFVHPDNQHLLREFLTDILQPENPITQLTVLNPEITKETVQQKNIVLDIRAQLDDGTRTDVEMQASWHPAFFERVLYYWSRNYTEQLNRSELYVELAPAVSVCLLDFIKLPWAPFHSVFRVLEETYHQPLTHHLAIHLLQLPRLRKRGRWNPDVEPEPVLRWGKFFAARSDKELEQLAMNDPTLEQAKQALERLSADQAARELVRERELGDWNLKQMLHWERKAGEAKGEARGRAEAARQLLQKLLRLKFPDVPESALSPLDGATEQQLNTWADRVLTAASIDDVFEATE